MKISKTQLKKIIKEEISKALEDRPPGKDIQIWRLQGEIDQLNDDIKALEDAPRDDYGGFTDDDDGAKYTKLNNQRRKLEAQKRALTGEAPLGSPKAQKAYGEYDGPPFEELMQDVAVAINGELTTIKLDQIEWDKPQHYKVIIRILEDLMYGDTPTGTNLHQWFFKERGLASERAAEKGIEDIAGFLDYIKDAWLSTKPRRFSRDFAKGAKKVTWQ